MHRRVHVTLAATIGLPRLRGDGHTFATLTECVEEGHDLPEAQGIAHCLIDQGFGDGITTVEDCVAYVTANGGYPDSRDEACADFIAETQP